MFIGCRLILLPLMLGMACVPGMAQFPGAEASDQIKPTLVADTTAIEAGKPFTAGVRFEIKNTWYTYWKFVGDIGMPLEVVLELPPGFKAGPLQWPLPVSHAAAGDFLNYVYERETMLFAEITPPANLSADRVTLKAKATWQACDPMTCVPGAATVELPLATGRTQPANAELFAKWRAQIPKTNPPPFQIEWQRDKANEFTIRIVGLGKDFNAEFFPLPPSKEVKPGHPKLSDVADDGTRTITFPIEEGGAPNLPWEGVIATSKEGAPREGWHVAAAGQVSESASTARPAPPAVDGSTAAPTSLLAILWGAFVGGLILNLMPCVLPVIALKIFGFISQANEEPRRVFHLGLAFAAGVLVFFLGLAALAIGLRAAGHGFFWGMQFSDPRLLIGLISLVVLFALSMFGAFDITLGGATENTIGKLAGRGGYSGAFVHGLFTTLLGTSCTAPFVGPVLGLAVTQPPVVIVAIFATMAAGMSLPYVLLTWKPAWMRFLPKPGVWMERFKQLMGFVLLAVAIWLLGVVGSTRGATAMTAVAWFLTFLAVAAWIFGAGQRRWWAVVLALMVASAGGAVFLPDAMKKKASPGEREIKPNSVGIVWEPYSEGRLEEARKAGPAFIDFTAEWCPNCKANEKFVINTKPVADAFRAKRVTTLVADWTDFDPAITAKIKSFQRIGVPVYVLYPPGAAQPVVLPEFLTQAMLLRYLADLPD